MSWRLWQQACILPNEGPGGEGRGGQGGWAVSMPHHSAVIADSEANPDFGEPTGEDVSQVQ